MTTYRVVDYHREKVLGTVTVPVYESDKLYPDDEAVQYHVLQMAGKAGFYHPRIMSIWGQHPRTVWVEEAP
jgi:hypothetical protein